MTDEQITRAVFVQSARFNELMSSYDIIAIAKAGVIDMSSWDPDTHRRMREWARGTIEELPSEIQEHLASIPKGAS